MSMGWDCRKNEVVQRIYQRMGVMALKKVQSIVQNEAVAREVVQETFLKLWEKMPRFDSDKAAFKWVYRTSHNMAIDHVRRSTTALRLAPQPEAYAVTPERELATRQQLTHIFGHLDARETEIYLYRKLDGMTQTEISEVTGKSERQIRRILKACEEKLALVSEVLLK